MAIFTLPQEAPAYSLLKPAADAAGRTSAYLSLKFASMAWVKYYITQGNAATIALSLLQAKDVSGTSSKAFSVAVPIWTDLDADTAGTALTRFTRQPDASSFTTDAATKTKIVYIQLDPAKLDCNNGFCTIAAVTGASNAANITSAELIFQPRLIQDGGVNPLNN
jgi:hypothetical protein